MTLLHNRFTRFTQCLEKIIFDSNLKHTSFCLSTNVKDTKSDLIHPIPWPRMFALCVCIYYDLYDFNNIRFKSTVYTEDFCHSTCRKYFIRFRSGVYVTTLFWSKCTHSYSRRFIFNIANCFTIGMKWSKLYQKSKNTYSKKFLRSTPGANASKLFWTKFVNIFCKLDHFIAVNISPPLN